LENKVVNINDLTEIVNYFSITDLNLSEINELIYDRKINIILF